MGKRKKSIDGVGEIISYISGNPYINPMNITENPRSYILSIAKPSYITAKIF